MTRRLMSIDEVAARLGLSKQTLYRWRSEGHDMPPAVKIGGRIRWFEDVVEEWLERQMEER